MAMKKPVIRKWLPAFLLLCVLLLLSGVACAASMKAVPTGPSWPASSRTVGGTTFVTGEWSQDGYPLYATRDGTTRTVSGRFAGGNVVSDGKTVYLPEKKSGKIRLIRYEVDSGSREDLGRLIGSSNYSVDLEGYYNGKIYYVIDCPEGEFACFSLKNRKMKKLVTGSRTVSTADQHGKYFILTDGTGAGFSYLGVWNAASDKLKVVAYDPYEWIITSKEIYYAKILKGYSADPPVTIAVCRYSLSGGKNVTLVKKIKDVMGIKRITTKYIQYRDGKGKVRKVSW